MNNIDEKIAALRAEVEKMIAALENEVKKAEQPMRFEPKDGEIYLFVDRTGEIGTFAASRRAVLGC